MARMTVYPIVQCIYECMCVYVRVCSEVGTLVACNIIRFFLSRHTLSGHLPFFIRISSFAFSTPRTYFSVRSWLLAFLASLPSLA